MCPPLWQCWVPRSCCCTEPLSTHIQPHTPTPLGKTVSNCLVSNDELTPAAPLLIPCPFPYSQRTCFSERRNVASITLSVLTQLFSPPYVTHFSALLLAHWESGPLGWATPCLDNLLRGPPTKTLPPTGVPFLLLLSSHSTG